MKEAQQSPTAKTKEEHSPYREVEPFNFPVAMCELLKGVNVTKLEWDNVNIYLTMDEEKLMIKLEDGLLHPLIVSTGDMSGEDWVCVP